MAIKACLMQNFGLVAYLVLELLRHQISLSRMEPVIEFEYFPPENGFDLKKTTFLCPDSFSSTQN